MKSLSAGGNAEDAPCYDKTACKQICNTRAPLIVTRLSLV